MNPYILAYLVAIITANLSSTFFGPKASIVNAFFFIGFDLRVRDNLHDAWEHKHLWSKMFTLIIGGSFLSWLANGNAGQIALASMTAFALASCADTIVYHKLGDRARLLRINGSNLAGAAVDSLVFPSLAFNGINWGISAGQFAAKFAGGFLWSLLLKR